jgi:hypothetical protein
MDSALQPMSTSQVLDRTFFLYRKHFWLFAGASAILPCLLLIMQFGFAALGLNFQDTQSISSAPEKFFVLLFGYALCYMLIFIVGHALATGATVYTLSQVHLNQPVTMAAAYRKVFSRLWAVMGISGLILLVETAAAMVAVVLISILIAVTVPGLSHGGSASSVVITIVAVLLSFAIGIAVVLGVFYLYLRFCLAIPAAMIEGLGPIPAFKRSFWLSQGAVIRLFLLYLLAGVIAMGLSLVFALPGQLLAIFLVMKKSFLPALLIQNTGAFIAQFFAGPIAPIAVALIYYDQRVRKEAFDLQLMMQSIEQQTPPPPAPAMSPIG